MTTYAQVVNGVCRVLIDQDTPPVVAPGDAFTYVDVTAANPQPATGWTTPDGGKTWAAPGKPAARPAIDWPTELGINEAYLAVIDPSDADDAAQLVALTRQMSALIAQATHTPPAPPQPPRPPAGLH